MADNGPEDQEVIQMGEDVKKAWHEKFFSEADLKEFAEVGKNCTPETNGRQLLS